MPRDNINLVEQACRFVFRETPGRQGMAASRQGSYGVRNNVAGAGKDVGMNVPGDYIGAGVNSVFELLIGETW